MVVNETISLLSSLVSLLSKQNKQKEGEVEGEQEEATGKERGTRGTDPGRLILSSLSKAPTVQSKTSTIITNTFLRFETLTPKVMLCGFFPEYIYNH